VVIATVVRQLIKTFRNSNVGILLLATLFVIALGTVGAYFAERPVNSQFANLGDSLWWTIVTLSTVGYGDMVPITLAGRVISAICMISGPVLMVSFVGSIGVRLYDRWTKGVRGMAQVKSKGHVVICGWNRRAEDIINEMKDSQLHNVPITIIDDMIQSNPVDDPRVSFVNGNASELRVLNTAHIAEARFAIVLAESGTPVADQKTVLTILAIKKCNRSIVTCAELNDANNEEHLKEAGCEIVINAGSLSGRLLAMSLQNPAVNTIIKELVSQERNEIYRVTVPAKYVGHSFLNALSGLKKLHGAITIGVERKGNVILNPAGDEVLKADDLLLVLSAEALSL
jgi:voltage-gated potassium channel